MESKNDKISGFQLGAITFFLSCSLFVGMGIASIFSMDSYNAWIAVLIGIVLFILPALLLIYIYNFQPDKNIFDKNKVLFGKIIGSIINFVLVLFVFYMLVQVLWANTSFAITMYLTKTPEYFVSGIFILTALYAVAKGVESIGRLCEILFFLSVIILLIIVPSLYSQINYDFFKPTLVNGITPTIVQSFYFIAYLLTPLIILLIVPKNKVVTSKNSKWFIVGGILMGIVQMFAVFFLIPGVITPELSAIYRFPAYYVLRKISIGGVINNVENFLSLHWFFHTFIFIVVGLYFISKYFEGLFNIKKAKISYSVLLVIGLLASWLGNQIFPDSVSALDFMRYKFHIYISATLFFIIIIVCILVFIKKKRKKAT